MPDALATAIHAWRTDPTGASGRAKLERVFSLFRSSQLAVPVDAEGQLLVMQHTTRGARLPERAPVYTRPLPTSRTSNFPKRIAP